MILESFIKYDKFLFGVFYIPPDISRSLSTLKIFEDILMNFSPIYENIIFVGDLNNNILIDTNPTSFLKKILDEQCFHIVNKEKATHFSQNSNSLLDIFFTNKPDNVSKFKQFHIPGISDHDLIMCEFTYKKNYPQGHFEYRDYSKFDINRFESLYFSLPWNDLFFILNVNDKINILNDYVLQLFNETVPIKKVRIKNPENPWFTDEIAKIIADRDLAYKLWVKYRTDFYRNSFKRLRNRATDLIRSAKNNFLRSKVNPGLQPRKLWSNIKEMGIGCDTNAIPCPFQAQDLANQFFSSSPFKNTDLRNHIPKTSGFRFDVIYELDMITALKKIKSNAIGVDGIPLKFLRLIFNYISPYILHIFNHIITSSTYPKCWKSGKVIPIPKNKAPKTVSDYRPITILPVLSKVFEHILKDQILSYINNCNKLCTFQSGFRPHHSTTSALLNVVDDLRKSMDAKKISILVLFDFSKAFDNIDHEILHSKLLSEFDFSSSAVSLIDSYLENRAQTVHLNKIPSNSVLVNKGVPQGTVLGPLLFSLFINDLHKCILNCSYHIFADDLQIYLSDYFPNLNYCIDKVNGEINNIFKWSEKHKLCLNASKTQSIIITRQNLTNIQLNPIVLNNCIIPFQDKVKNLGLIINNTLSWNDHLAKVSRTIFSSLRTFWSLTEFADTNFRLQMFKSFLLSHFLYADVVFFHLNQMFTNKLQKIFNACARYVFRLRKYDHISSFSRQLLNCEFKSYMHFRVCAFLYKLINFKQPTYLYNKLTFSISSRNNNLLLPMSRTNIYNSSFFVKGLVLWNALPVAITNAETLQQFRKRFFLSIDQ